MTAPTCTCNRDREYGPQPGLYPAALRALEQQCRVHTPHVFVPAPLAAAEAGDLGCRVCGVPLFSGSEIHSADLRPHPIEPQGYGDYAAFLAGKAQFDGMDGFEADALPPWLFGFQRVLVDWALQKGRAAIFADCGLGKTPMQLAWAWLVHLHTGRPLLVLTPLAVSFQTEAEAAKFGIEAAISRDGKITAAITITNYERLHYFDPADFAGVVCDESSAIKAFDGVRRALVTEFIRKLSYRLLCTATAAPNDYIELGTSSEALGHLGYVDMLSRFFVNDQHTVRPRAGAHWRKGGDWRLKGHAEEPFWRWVSSWARALRKPSDLGFPDDGFILPPLEHREHIVKARTLRSGQLFAMPAVGLQEENEEQRRTLTERCEKAAELLTGNDVGVAWCHRNAEGDLLTRLIPGAVQIKGSDDPDAKEERLLAFSRGDIRVLVTKPAIGAWGLNWQHCHRMTFFPSHSYEQYYQAVRRCWRFGQTEPVLVDIVTTEGGANALKSLERKAEQASAMFDSLLLHMRNVLSIHRSVEYAENVELPSWL